MGAEALGNLLAPVNAGLNFLSACFLVAGFVYIKRGRIDRHRAMMLSAVASSGLFLIFYVTRFALTGTHRFAGEGGARVFYLSLLFSHMILAALLAPMVLRLLYLALKDRFEDHRRLARWTWPIWMYVSVTGLTVYVMLYHVYGYL